MRNKEAGKRTYAHSVVLGLKAVSHSFKSGTDRKSGAPDGILFSVCDQPKTENIHNPKNIKRCGAA